MNWHQVIDERNFEMDQVIADILRRTPEKLALVTERLEWRLNDPDFSVRAKDALQEWKEVIDREGVAGALRILEDRGEEATRMRQSAPFAMLMPEDKRLEILKKYEARRPRAHPAGV